MAPSPIVLSNLAAISVDSFLYGIYFVLFCISTFLMIRRQQRFLGSLPVSRNPAFTGGLVLFLAISAHWLIVVYRSFPAFAYYDNGTAPQLYYIDLSRKSYVVASAMAELQPLVADLVLIYRLWIIWGRNTYIVILPLSIILAIIACSSYTIYQLVNFRIGDSIFEATLSNMITALCSMSAGNNVYCSGFIAWRLWHVHSMTRDQNVQGRLHILPILAVFIESAALYVFWTVFYLIIYATGSPLEPVIGILLLPIAGIAFTLINVRIGMGYAAEVYSSSRTLSEWQVAEPRRRVRRSVTGEPISLNVVGSMGDDVEGAKLGDSDGVV